MEFFLEFVFTIAFSLLSSFVVAKLLSVATTDDEHDLVKRKTTHCYGDSNYYDLDTETKLGFVPKFVGVDELGESIDGNVLAQQEISIDRQQIVEDELAREVEIVDLTEESEIEVGLIEEEVGMEKSEEIEIINSDLNCEIVGDWEGIERSDMDRLFGAAVAYVGSIDNTHKLSNLSSDLQLQLYGLHQVAIRGPCCVPQPMAFKLSARAKWNAWQQLGNMSPEVPMQHYINLLSKSNPDWMKNDIGSLLQEHGKQDSADNDACKNMPSALEPPLGNQQGAKVERSLEEHMPCDEGLNMDPNIKI